MESGAKLSALADLLAHLAGGDVPPPSFGALPVALVRKHLLGPLAGRIYPEFQRDRIASNLIAEVRRRCVREVVGELAENRVPVMLVKGIALARLYEDPADRPMSDVDLLVPTSAHSRAVRALERLGFWKAGPAIERSPFHHALTLQRKEIALDLHRFMIAPLRSRFDIDSIWERSEPADARFPRAFLPEWYDEALLHFTHIGRHELFVPAANYLDGVLLLRRLGPEGRRAVEARAAEFRVSRAVRAAITMTRALARPASSPSNRCHLLPGAPEILRGERPSRALQLARKAALLEGPGEVAGLAAVFLAERLHRGS